MDIETIATRNGMSTTAVHAVADDLGLNVRYDNLRGHWYIGEHPATVLAFSKFLRGES